MNRAVPCFFALLVSCPLVATAFDGAPTIWDNAAASEWDRAYPVGNGRLGAMPFGQFPKEKILINEETIWVRGEDLVTPEDSALHLEKMRQLEADGHYAEVDRYFETHLQNDSSPDSYQYLGWLRIEFMDAAELVSTYRALNLNSGVAETRYTLADGSTIRMETYASAPDAAIAVNLSSDQPLNLALSVEGALIEDSRVEAGDLVVRGAAEGESATRFEGRVRVFPESAAQAAGDRLEIKGSHAATIYLAAATDLDRRQVGQKLPTGWADAALADLDAVTGKSPKAVRSGAVEDHRRYFDRVELELGETDPNIRALPTKARLQRMREGRMDDPDLVED